MMTVSVCRPPVRIKFIKNVLQTNDVFFQLRTRRAADAPGDRWRKKRGRERTRMN